MRLQWENVCDKNFIELLHILYFPTEDTHEQCSEEMQDMYGHKYVKAVPFFILLVRYMCTFVPVFTMHIQVMSTVAFFHHKNTEIIIGLTPDTWILVVL